MHELIPRPNAVCSMLSKVSSCDEEMCPTIASAPAYGVAGSPVVPMTRIGGVPDAVTAPSWSPFAGFGMPTHEAVAHAPPHGGSCDWNVATSASSEAALGTFFAGRSTQLM